MKLFLIGFMGSGKSLIGQKLAAALGIGFLDLDDAIVAHAQMDIPTIFKEKGAAAFRETEQEVLKKTKDRTRTVVATGGGAPCFFDNMEWMNSEGVTVFLSAPVDLLVERLKGEKEKRPLLADQSNEALSAFIEAKLKERIGFYEMAQFRCNVDGPADEIVQYLAAYFKRFV